MPPFPPLLGGGGQPEKLVSQKCLCSLWSRRANLHLFSVKPLLLGPPHPTPADLPSPASQTFLLPEITNFVCKVNVLHKAETEKEFWKQEVKWLVRTTLKGDPRIAAPQAPENAGRLGSYWKIRF